MDKKKIENSHDIYLYKGTVDLNSAKCLLRAFHEDELEIDIEKIYFELQQSAEKYLKAQLSNVPTEAPKTHDLELLIDACRRNGIKLHERIDILIELSDYAVEGRYAIIHDDIDESDKYIELLEELYAKKNP